MDYFIFWRMYELFHRFYRYKFVGEIHLDKSRLRRKCLKNMPKNRVLRTLHTIPMMVIAVRILTDPIGND